ncbi:leucyl aminopeptidase [Lysobacter korlensis]|uniref:Probable cytosol aminopeptidase n=1 Tax=Lysobacter korlensis TaxID=553636 RepID=A0ABV6RM99_9GAMM
MPTPTLSLTSAAPLTAETDVLVLGVRKTGNGPALATDGLDLPETPARELQELLAPLGITGGTDELRRIAFSPAAAKSVALVGLGGADIDPDTLRYAAGSATRQLRGISNVVIALPVADDAATAAVLEGAALGAYSFTDYRSSSLGEDKEAAASVAVWAPAEAPAVLERAGIVRDAVFLVRDLVNTPPSDLYPQSFAERAIAAAEGLPVEVTVLAEDGLEAGGFGGILGVGKGSSRGPRLVTLRYAPKGAAKHVALVGKGITFDSGGLSLKPAASMVGMKYDMTGAATVLAVTLAAARLELPVALTTYLCIAENMPSGTAARPNDVITIRGGTTVEILNTDAEGRLVMADGIVAASEQRPDAILDVATLTGAATVALGTRYVGAMGDEQLVGRVLDAAKRAGETLWPMPLPGELRSLLNSDVADIANAKPGNTAAGMLLAGVFLSEFVGRSGDEPDAPKIPWAHLDIAGAANNSAGGYGFTGKGPTGVAVRALLRLAEDFSAAV